MRGERTLHELYDYDFDLFVMMTLDGSFIAWGFDTPEDAWAANPTVEWAVR